MKNISLLDSKDQKKSEFWETKTEGKREVWDALKVISEADSLELANAIITSLNLTIAHTNYHEEFKVWDEYGDVYVVPAWVYAPSKVQEDEETPVEYVARDPNASVKVRLSTGAPDISVRCHTQDPVFSIIQQVLNNSQDKNITIKLFYLGKRLEVHKKIVDVLPHIADQETIIQAMILTKN